MENPDFLTVVLSQIPAGALSIVTGYLALQLQRKSVVQAEYKILEETCTRQRGEIKDLNQELGKMKERTDLQPVIEALNRHSSESNTRFDRAMQIQDETIKIISGQSRLLEANTKAVEALTRSHEQMILHLFPGREQ